MAMICFRSDWVDPVSIYKLILGQDTQIVSLTYEFPSHLGPYKILFHPAEKGKSGHFWFINRYYNLLVQAKNGFIAIL